MVAAAAGMGCRDATGPRLQTEGPPTAMVVGYSGFGYGSHEVRLRGGDTLVVTRVRWVPADSAAVRTVVPEAAAWRAFWAAASRAGLARWPARCVNREIADGGGLSIALTVDGQSIERRYTNASPRRVGTCTTDGSRSAEEIAFATAVEQLIGAPFP
jgi:hypothetical protein